MSDDLKKSVEGGTILIVQAIDNSCGNEAILLTTSGTHVDNKIVSINSQEIEMCSYGNSATLHFGYLLTPEKLRQLADELEQKLSQYHTK